MYLVGSVLLLLWTIWMTILEPIPERVTSDYKACIAIISAIAIYAYLAMLFTRRLKRVEEEEERDLREVLS